MDEALARNPLLRPGAIEPREYQLNIARAALGRNTLVVLPTALGKTVISALVAAEVLYRHRRSRVLVLAPTKPLVSQHMRSFSRILRLGPGTFAMITGEVPPAARGSLWRGGSRLVFATPEAVRNDAEEGRVDLSQFGLIVFDEAHRAVGEYAYVRIADAYFSASRSPLVLGTTASPGSTVERVLQVCRNLRIERVEYRDEDDPDVRPYVHRVDVEWVRVRLPPAHAAMASIIESMLRRRLEWLASRGYLRSPSPREVGRRELVELGEELRYALEAESVDEERGVLFEAIVNQSAAMTLYHMLELAGSQGVHALRAFMERLESEEEGKRSHSLVTGDPDYARLRALAQGTREDHPKVARVRELVEAQLASNPSSRILVFTQYRDTVARLVEELSRVRGARVGRFVGQASRGGVEGMRQEEQVAAVRALEEGEHNVLVATSIAEEGLDMPSVDRVIFYEPIPSEIRYIQRRGRTGRRAPGRVTILAAEGTADMAYLYASARRARRMREVVRRVNSLLGPVLRFPEPPDPMSPEEVEAEARAAGEGIPASAGAKELRAVYDALLEAGPSGIGEGELLESLRSRLGMDPASASAALRELVRRGSAVALDGRYAAREAIEPAGEVHEVEVVEVRRGYAIVRVDGDARAIMEPGEFSGPPWLVRRGSRFLAAASIREVGGELHLGVLRVIRRL
ncbi:MAG: helicase-related protein [Nitrososphaeria archaeon]